MSTSESEQPGQERRISDAQTMRALSHPVRIAIWEALTLGGAMTATQVGERIGESPTTCSFHLRQLQKYGFVEEAGGGRGRSRPWRIAHFGISFSTSNDDPETEVASSSLARMFRERQQSRYQTWLETRNTFPPAWREAAGETEAIMYCTAEELEQLNEDLRAMLIPRFQARVTNPELRPPGSVPVEMHLTSFPIEHPGPGPEQSG
jgi:predicted ArsR family transcriptional regulator